MDDPFAFSMEPNEIIKYFNQRLTAILNKFKHTKKPIEKIQVEV